MAEVVLSLFGAPRVAGTPDAAEVGSKSLALLAFLALEPGAHRRDELAALLWSDAPEDAARASLRQALAQIRRAVGDCLEAGRQEVGLAAPIRSDAADFLAAADRSPAEAARYEVPRFLSGFSLKGAEGWEEWADRTRRRLLQRHEAALRELTKGAVARSRWREALGLAERWLETDPFSEEATGTAMQALYCLGDRGAALARFQEFKARLAAEASAAPLPWLADLARRIERAAAIPTLEDDGAGRPSFEADLVGRAGQWVELTDAWANALRGRPETVFIQGEAGMGKTRLAEEFGRWVAARGGIWLRGQGYQASGTGAFGTMAAALRGVLDAPGLAGAPPEALSELSRLLPEVRTRFPGVPAPQAGEGAARQQLFEGVTQVLLAVGSEGPLLLMVDDLHWCDAESCALIQFLSQRLNGIPWMLLGTITEGEVAREASASRLLSWFAGRGGARRVTLGPLSVAELWEMVRQLGKIRDPRGGQRFAHRLREITEGNPFHVIELLKTLFDQGVIGLTPVSREWVVGSRQEGETMARLDLPQSVREAIAHRVDRLPYELRDVLVTVAVARRPVTLGVLTLVHGISRLRAAALGDALIERHLLRAEGGAYCPAQPAIAAVVRGGLSPVRNVEIHRALAFALEASTPDEPGAAAEIAWHAEQAGEVDLARRHAGTAEEATREQLGLDELGARLAFTMPTEPAGLGGTDLDLRRPTH